MDFVKDALATGRRIKCLACVDDFTMECMTSNFAFGITGDQVTRLLDSIAIFRGYLVTVGINLVPEFTCWMLNQWALLTSCGVAIYSAQ
jgi:putative transposase